MNKDTKTLTPDPTDVLPQRNSLNTDFIFFKMS